MTEQLTLVLPNLAVLGSALFLTLSTHSPHWLGVCFFYLGQQNRCKWLEDIYCSHTNHLTMPSLTIWIEHENSYELATELVLALQESRALVKPVSAPQTDNSKTTLDLPDLQADAREKVMRETSNWANTKGLKFISTNSTQDSDACYLTIH